MPTDPDPILNIVKKAQEGALRWERTELRNRADKEQRDRLAEKLKNLRSEIVTKQAAAELCLTEYDNLCETIEKQEQWLNDHHEDYRKDKEVGSDEIIKKLQDKLTRQLKEMARTEEQLEEAKRL